MQERPLISSYTLIEQTPDRLAFDVTMDLKPLLKRILVPVGVIEGILISIFLILLFLGVLASDPFILIFMLIFVIALGVLLVILPMFSEGVNSFVLDKNYGTCSISSQYFKRHSRGLKMHFSYSLDTLKSLEIINANEQRGPGASMLRRMYKGMYLLRFNVFLPVRHQGNFRASPEQGSAVLFADSQPERVEDLKNLIEGFLNSSPTMPGYSNDEQFLPPTNLPADLACPRCGYRYAASARISFCPNCGESLEIAWP